MAAVLTPERSPRGGLRERLLFDSVVHHVVQGLTCLGWFDTDRQHRPIVVDHDVAPYQKQVALNTLALVDETNTVYDDELGSNAVVNTRSLYWDFYAENDVVGRHLIGDIRDILGGHRHELGPDYRGPEVPLVDFSTGERFGTFEVEGLDTLRNFEDESVPYRRYWFTCRVSGVDTYGHLIAPTILMATSAPPRSTSFAAAVYILTHTQDRVARPG